MKGFYVKISLIPENAFYRVQSISAWGLMKGIFSLKKSPYFRKVISLRKKKPYEGIAFGSSHILLWTWGFMKGIFLLKKSPNFRKLISLRKRDLMQG